MTGTILVVSAERRLLDSGIFPGPHARDHSKHVFCQLRSKKILHVGNLPTPSPLVGSLIKMIQSQC